LKKRKTGKLSSKKNKKEGLFSKENLKWGLGGVVVLSVASFWLLSVPCELSGPLPFSFCYNTVIFGVLNLIGGFIGGILGLSSHSSFHLISIIFSTPIYYLLGILLKNIFRKI